MIGNFLEVLSFNRLLLKPNLSTCHPAVGSPQVALGGGGQGLH